MSEGVSIKKFILMGLASWSIGALLITSKAQAAEQNVKFSEDELAYESVLPVYDETLAVRKRLVETSGRIEAGAFGGLGLNEPFSDFMAAGGYGTYHFSETNGLQLWVASLIAKANQFATKVYDQTAVTDTKDLKYVPAPKMVALLAWEFTPYYGKISITKQSVANISIYTTLGGGMVTVGDGSSPAGALGVGQKFWFGRTWGFGVDFRGILYNGPNPISPAALTGTATQEISYSKFEKKLSFNMTLGAGLYFLF